ncbi:carbohydrate porin [Acetobacter nitrogenifigens]|nr:carbohydrate porin [Acetobacter nitrogenifigens]
MKTTYARICIFTSLCFSIFFYSEKSSAQIMINSGLELAPKLEYAKPLPKNLPFFPTGVLPRYQTFYGDPGHVRNFLADKGIVTSIDYRSLINGNVTGGIQRTSAVANQIALTVDINWAKLLHIPGLTSYFAGINRFGSNLSTHTGNSLVRAENFLVSSSGDSPMHLAYAYFDERFAHGRASIALGRFPVGMTFGSSPLNCNFVGNALCGNVKALTGKDISYTVFPNSSWASRFTFYLKRNMYIQSGLFSIDQTADSGSLFDRTGWKWSTRHITGWTSPFEIGYIPLIGARQLIGHYKAGFSYAHAQYTTFDGQLYKNRPTSIGYKTKFWLMADQMLLRQGSGLDTGLIVAAAFVRNQHDVSTYGDQAIISVVDRGFWHQRPTDALGFLVSTLWISPNLSRLQKRQYKNGERISGGVTTPQNSEQNFELFYDGLIVPGIRMEPDIQYIIHPNAQRSIPDSLVLNLMVRVYL